MVTYNANWAGSWTATSIAASTVTNSSTATTAAIDNDNITSTEIAVTIVYGGTTNEGARVYVLRDVGGTYEVIVDGAWGFMMAYSVSGTYRRSFVVQSINASKFKVMISNSTGASITATVSYKQATIDQV